MITLQEAKKWIYETLVPLYDTRECAAITKLFIEHITNLSITQQLINKDVILNTTQELILNQGISQLKVNTPIQQIIGFSWFDNDKYIVNTDVLIPRPETEELLQWVKDDVKMPKTIIDVGTGSGILAVSLKKYFINAEVNAVDVCHKALFIAKQNAVALNKVIAWHHIDFLDSNNWQLLPKCSLLISNPPYIKNTERETMHLNVLEHEPHKALFVDNEDALVFYKALAKFSIEKLEANGVIFVEINETLGNETRNIFENLGFCTELRKDIQQKDRMIKAWKA